MVSRYRLRFLTVVSAALFVTGILSGCGSDTNADNSKPVTKEDAAKHAEQRRAQKMQKDAENR